MPGGETDYKTEVQRYSDEELLSKERSKRRRKTGDVVGTGLSAAAAMASPAMWAAAGASAKNYLGNSSKHKIILKEMSRRGLEPIKEDMSDTLMPILASAGSMFVGRAFGGAAGQGMASQAGSLLQSVSSRAFSSGSSKAVSKSSKKDKVSKKSKTSPAMVPYTSPQSQMLATPSAYQIPPNQPPPATIVYNYIPPSAEFPQGYYAPAPVAVVPAAPQYAQQQQPQPPVFQQQPQMPPQQAPNFQPLPPALQYLQTPPQPQYYNGGLQRAQSIYANPPAYQAAPPRAQTFPYM